MEGGTPRTVFRHYVRIKIFTERGREAQSKIDIPFLSNWSIKDIAARTIKPDGSIVELKKEDILERTIVKEGKTKINAKSFASYEVKNGELVFTRALTQRATTIPAAEYQVIRRFFESMRAAEQAPVVLARK